ncbi:MAG: VCBS repeat-containing protein, partial [Polyangiaceae bacterium]|nr:VCBS repeat-containing protein [Polyangiaceae bacterium]
MLHAVSVVGGAAVEKWFVPGVLNATKQLAAGNIDGQPGNEIIGCGVDGAVHAFTGSGAPLWTSEAMTCLMPSIADLDGDGAPEVIAEGGILNGANGTIKAPFSAAVASSLVVSDIDGDGKLDIVTSSQGYHADGTLFVDTGLANQGNFYGTSDWKSPWPAVADFDKDGKPEVVVVDNLNHALSIWRYDAAQPGGFMVVRSPVDING